MSKRTGSWRCALEGYPAVTTDDLTLDELEMAEKASGVPYTMMDPHLSVGVAKGLFAVMMLRAQRTAGVPDDQAVEEALAVAGQLPVKALHDAFTFLPPETAAEKLRRRYDAAEADVPPSSAPTSVAG